MKNNIHSFTDNNLLSVNEAMYAVFHLSFAVYIVCRCYKPCEFLGFIWTDCWPGVTIRTRTKQPQLTSVIRKRRLQWFGHVQRMDIDCIPKKVYTWKPVHGNCRPGRPKMSWKEVIKKDINKVECGWSVEEADEVVAKDRSI